MDWAAPVDIYCERVTPGLAGEPLNALSNAAFFCAAAYGMMAARRAGSGPVVWSLSWLVAVIGLGSFLFHTVAQRWSEVADVVPITIFIYAYFGFALRRFAGVSWPWAMFFLFVLLAINIAVEFVASPDLLNGSLAYLPALLAATCFALALRAQAHPAYRYLGAAAALFALSLAFRTADRAVCPILPIGTHFLWHMLNAAMLALYLEAAAGFGGRAFP